MHGVCTPSQSLRGTEPAETVGEALHGDSLSRAGSKQLHGMGETRQDWLLLAPKNGGRKWHKVFGEVGRWGRQAGGP